MKKLNGGLQISPIVITKVTRGIRINVQLTFIIIFLLVLHSETACSSILSLALANSQYIALKYYIILQ